MHQTPADMSIFTRIIAGEIPSYKIAESERFFAFLDINPVQKAHTLVVPKIEIDRIFDVPDEYLAELLVFAKPIAKAIEKVVKCDRVNILTVGLEVPHAHVHLIATNRTSDLDLHNPKIKYSPEEFATIQQQIIEAMNG
jgi:histidine triad (HIT) family protein